ncbi:hypothetical protein Mp_3g04950 [Marchantia polymorpha subsp. ruderalis]|uniref:Uncharacterized protein n=2 Tax=Marchantia polymorpha TaxID=3197 RepID=A0AAF6AXJ1_MARPO|nr:hypothetical protein MARPO_0022s0034 [Marchantia polymorpha]BBN04475.1 hypothetical protein Mp_3g04950 [Marchantia polymorpha subsp. ruderalis]|eukprot:PTQ43927.1 hypothetical protein MARPO_0022s0034 [Marchantia polymorpha]
MHFSPALYLSHQEEEEEEEEVPWPSLLDLSDLISSVCSCLRSWATFASSSAVENRSLLALHLPEMVPSGVNKIRAGGRATWGRMVRGSRAKNV